MCSSRGRPDAPIPERALLIDDAVEAPTGNVRSIHGAWNQRISVSRKIDERLIIVPSIIKPDASALGGPQIHEDPGGIRGRFPDKGAAIGVDPHDPAITDFKRAGHRSGLKIDDWIALAIDPDGDARRPPKAQIIHNEIVNLTTAGREEGRARFGLRLRPVDNIGRKRGIMATETVDIDIFNVARLDISVLGCGLVIV